jgi:hypothetical protein
MKILKNTWEVSQINLNVAREFVEEHHYAHGAARTAVACYGMVDATTFRCSQVSK